MNRTLRNFIGLNALLTLISATVGVLILYIVFPGNYFSGYPLIPIYFFLFGLGSIFVFDLCRRDAPQKLMLLYWAVKMCKLILSLMLLLIYCVIVRNEARLFLLTFIVFYLIFLIYENWFFFVFEKNLQRKKTKLEKNETVA